MSQTYYAILTAIGEAKFANAAALGTQLQLTKMAVGDGNGTAPQPSRDQKALVHETRRAPLNQLLIDPANPSQIVAEQIIPEDVGGWWIREIGLYDAAGDLCAVANCPDTYKPVLSSGSGRTQIIRMALIVSNASAVELKVDPSVVLAPRGYVDSSIAAHKKDADPHSQYLTDLEAAALITKALEGKVSAEQLAQAIAAVPKTPSVRQTVLSAAVNALGQAAFIMAGVGLSPQLLAKDAPVSIAFAQGIKDYVETITVDMLWPAVPASNNSFLSAARTGPGAVTLGSTLALPQYGNVYNQTTQAKLDLNNTALDDFGNAWVNSGVTFSNASPMLQGTYVGVYNGASVVYSQAFTTLYQAPGAGFSLRALVKTSTLSPVQQALFSATSANGTGMAAAALNSTGKVALYLSSQTGTNDIANGTTGAATLAAGTPYFVEICHDQLAGKYYLYVNGVLDQTITSTKQVGAFSRMLVGGGWNGSGYSNFFTGFIQGFEFLPYCDHPAGAAYAVPAALKSVAAPGYAADWIDTSQGITVKQVSGPSVAPGTPPAFTPVQKAYLGECLTGVSTVTAPTSYALNGRYDSGLFPVSVAQTYAKAHNVGVMALVTVTMADDAFGTNERSATPTYYQGSSGYGCWAGATSRNSCSVLTNSSGVGLTTGGGGMGAAYFRIVATRPWGGSK